MYSPKNRSRGVRRHEMSSSNYSSSTRPASYRNGRVNKSRRRKQKSDIMIADHKQLILRTIMLWIIGIILIEFRFFYTSIHTLDRTFLRGRAEQPFDMMYTTEGDKRPPRPIDPPPPKASLLPKKVITVLGPESSGTTFMATTLGIAVGAFTEDGGWSHTPAWAFSHSVPTTGNDKDKDQGNYRMHRQYHPRGRWEYERDLGRRAMTSDGEWEIQHLSLPWGWMCEEDEDVSVVEALVPQECFRYENPWSHLHPKTAEKLWYATRPKKGDAPKAHEEKLGGGGEDTADAAYFDSGNEEKERIAKMCREEVNISEEKDAWTCGAKCGTGKYNGYALYPKRFSVNITSHIEWYASRGVDIKVILSMRDRTISHAGQLKGHCHLDGVGRRENEVALGLITDALKTDVGVKERIISVSYEGMMAMQEAYLHRLYRQLGINSTYLPSFSDGNKKYITDANMGKKEEQLQLQPINRPPKPKSFTAPPLKKHLLPKRVITIFGPESSGTRFLSSTLGVATNSFPSDGLWSHIIPLPSKTSSPSEEWVFHQHNYRRAMSLDGEWEIQHISLPWGWTCQGNGADTGSTNIVEALVPAECFRYEVNPELNPESAERMWRNENKKRIVKAQKGRRLETNAIDNGYYDGMRDSSEVTAMEAAISEQCRKEVHIMENNSTPWTCGAKCGSDQFDGFALYPRRLFVNITSHIEWYRSRGVHVTALLSMRDLSISGKGKLRDHCTIPGMAKEEDELALSIMKESLQTYSKLNSNGRPHVIPVSYEGLMQYRSAYLMNLYKQLGISSSHSPTFEDGNEKYVKEDEENLPAFQHQKPKKSYLPKKVITVLGTESSGTTFLATTLGVAVGAIDASGASISRQAMSSDGEWEIQHLSLPWGWQCEENEDIYVVEALVPEECFRYERDPSLESHLAADVFFKARRHQKPGHIGSEGADFIIDKNADAKHREAAAKFFRAREHRNPGHSISEGTADSSRENMAEANHSEEEVQRLSKCRNEVKISHNNDEWTCGAKCGTGQFDGFALYPQRFFVNITSHIEWYVSRGVEITVVMSLRDRNISSKSKLKDHCHLDVVGRRENEVALSLMSDALKNNGGVKERIISVSYEGMMEMEDVYLSALYKDLGINSTYVPQFNDGNEKYVTNANVANVGKLELQQDRQQQNFEDNSLPPKPKTSISRVSKTSILAKKLISVVGSTSFITTTLAVAAGAFPSKGRWVEKAYGSGGGDAGGHDMTNQPELVFEDRVNRTVTSSNGEWSIQHISLPHGSKCNNTIDHVTDLVEALVPEECFLVESALKVSSDPKIMEQCRNEVHIAEDNTSWTCGANCGKDKSNGSAIYPARFFVNITSHIEWYLSRGVDVTVVLEMRDRSVSMKQKLREDCHFLEITEKEEKIKAAIKKEAYAKYGKHGSQLKSGDKERVIAVSYEGLQELKEVYLFDLYHQLGIKSTYAPSFIDGNAKYVADPMMNAAMNGESIRHKKKAAPLHLLPWS